MRASTAPASAALFEPIGLRSLEIRNRVWMSPMCQYSAAPDGAAVGAPHEWHRTHLASRAVGGVGLVMTEATAVLAEGRLSKGDLGLWSGTQQTAFADLVAAIEQHGAVAGIQLAHAGRKASVAPPWHGGGSLGPEAWSTVGPTDEPFGRLPPPSALDHDGIAHIVDAFAAAARRALAAGFKVVEIHGAHGYLIHQFLSPASNTRSDAYGGDFAGRIRLAVEIVDAIRAVWPDDLPVLFRISVSDWFERHPETDRPGWTAADSVQLARVLSRHGVDLIDASSGGIVPGVTIPVAPGYQLPFAATVRRGAALPVGAVGLITEPSQAESMVADGDADVVLLGRALLRDPYWPLRAREALGAGPAWPVQYARAARAR